MIKWFEDDEVLIEFNKAPNVGIRYIMPYLTKKEEQDIKKLPFVNREDLEVHLTDFNEDDPYIFVIPSGFCYDGASIPKIFWRIIGSNTDNEFLIASLIHDVLCINHKYVKHDRAFSTKVFRALLIASGVSKVKACVMANAVDLFQKMFGGWK